VTSPKTTSPAAGRSSPALEERLDDVVSKRVAAFGPATGFRPQGVKTAGNRHGTVPLGDHQARQ
jgi:hypothetical protein